MCYLPSKLTEVCYIMRGIICLCGSTKFKQEFEKANRLLTMSDWIVLSVGSFHHSEDNSKIKSEIVKRKRQLDLLHLRKIELAQVILIIDVKGYIGISTKREIEYAQNLGKNILYYSYGVWKALLLVQEVRRFE